MWWNVRDGSVYPSEGEGVGGYHRDLQEVCSQLSADGSCWSSDVSPIGVEIPHADRTGGKIVYGPGGGGIGKQVSSKNYRTGEHIR